jgi:hypothetical protein
MRRWLPTADPLTAVWLASNKTNARFRRNAAVPQSLTTADYVVMVAVIVPCLFAMSLLPLIVNFLEERRSRGAPHGKHYGHD